jgi:hypothetical protein
MIMTALDQSSRTHGNEQVENSWLLGCYAVSTGTQLPTFRKILLPNDLLHVDKGNITVNNLPADTT